MSNVKNMSEHPLKEFLSDLSKVLTKHKILIQTEDNLLFKSDTEEQSIIFRVPDKCRYMVLSGKRILNESKKIDYTSNHHCKKCKQLLYTDLFKMRRSDNDNGCYLAKICPECGPVEKLSYVFKKEYFEKHRSVTISSDGRFNRKKTTTTKIDMAIKNYEPITLF